jgi:hypothetical protein
MRLIGRAPHVGYKYVDGEAARLTSFAEIGRGRGPSRDGFVSEPSYVAEQR